MAKRKNVAPPAPGLFPFPRKAVWVDPTSLGTADAGPVCRADDSCLYATKGVKHHAHVPHAEWFCTHLGELIGIAAPPCAIIEIPGGDLVFGSRWEGGVIPPASPWWFEVKSGRIPLANVAAALTHIYAFDHFIHNVDRHTNNFIVREQKGGHALIANDYSRAWLVHGFPLPAGPMAANENTVKCQRQLTAQLGSYIDPKEARTVMERLKAIPTARARNIIESHPEPWLAKAVKGQLLGWWETGGMSARAELVAKGIEDGTYL
ncbi:MAG TPA: HipA family kinase [Stellaceae bacterium]|nr:HipA family kinase [Stellaceae bacterium]